MTRRAPALAACLALLIGGTTALFGGTLAGRGVLSTDDLLHSFYPWAYATGRVPPSNLSRSDDVAFHQPLALTHWPRVRAGDLPDYDPLVLGGTPSFQQGLSVGQVVSPAWLPYHVVPATFAAALSAAWRLMLAGLFMWLLLRRWQLGAAAAAAGAGAFAFNGVFVAWLLTIPPIVLWLPLAVWLADRAVAHGRTHDWAALALALGAQFTGAYLPPSLVVVVVTSAFALAMIVARRRWGALPWLAAAGAASLLVGAAALASMIPSLWGSPVAARSMADATAPLANLATFAVPGWWGSPVDRTWWFPGPQQYPELVAYLGVTTVVLAGAGVVAFAWRRADRRAWFLTALAVFVLLVTYGSPLTDLIAAVPGLRQTNPARWNVALAFAVAALAAFGVESLVGPARHTAVEVTANERRERGWALAGAAGGAALLAVGVAIALVTTLAAIRARHFQAVEKAQITRFAVLAGACLVVAALASLARARATRSSRWTRLALAAASLTLPLLVVGDLVSAGAGFNPVVAADRAVPAAPAIEFLAAKAGAARVAPIGTADQFLQGHVWATYGLPSITGFDFQGDESYGRFVARIERRTPPDNRFGFVELRGDGPLLDLRLLGLLNVEWIVAAPVDTATAGGGYRTAGELTAGRRVSQRFVCRHNGLRGIDVLTATFERVNDGAVEVALAEADSGAVVARRTVRAADVPNNAWLRLDVPEQAASAGRAYRIELTGTGATAGRAVTAWLTQDGSTPGAALEIDAQPAGGTLWFRAFSSAPDRWPGATLVYARDLNIYRNTHVRPRAWFVSAIERLPLRDHLNRLVDDTFDPATTVLLEPDARVTMPGAPVTTPGAPRAIPYPRGSATEDPGTVPDASGSVPEALGPVTEGARPTLDAPRSAAVTAVGPVAGDNRTFTVEAPTGGLLVVSERYHEGWRAFADGRPVPLARADAVLVAVPVPPGTTQIRLEFRHPRVRAGLAATGLASAILLVVVVAGHLRARRGPLGSVAEPRSEA